MSYGIAMKFHSQSCVRHAPDIDLVLLSHGDLAHSGLYAYAYARWGLKAPAYTTLPVQAMGRIAATEDVEGIRDEEEVEDEQPTEVNETEETKPSGEDEMQTDPLPSEARVSGKNVRKYIATLQEVHDAFDSLNVLRYSQPCHLQGIILLPY